MKLNDIRNTFLNHFERDSHKVVPSSPLVPNNDPTLMFANSGMVQFKNVFTGLETLDYSRATTSQKCIRAGGKHNDLENVGYTARHHTFFEMLGNFSFGDYFKEHAIEMAWNLITREFGINKDKLWITIYHTDEEAFNIWKKITGFNDVRIVRISTNDNFWSMGETGPCGPCSEIFYDHGEDYEGSPPSEADDTRDRFVEIWNLVFMQYEQIDANNRIDLPKPSIDTGMGLERIAAVLQGTNNNYDIDSFQAIINQSIDLTNMNDKGSLTSHRVIADHLRSSCFLIADGVLPSNEGRGYVLRRIMRRAMRHVHMLNYKDPLIYQLVPSVVSNMSSNYPELSRAETLIKETLKYEELRFKDLLSTGIKQLDDEVSKLSSNIFPGQSAFKLYDTFGFPLDLTEDILRVRNINLDKKGFDAALDKQKANARKNWSGTGSTATEKIWFDIVSKSGTTDFLGYEENNGEAIIQDIIIKDNLTDNITTNDDAIIILNQTTFYAESGGQIGDTGTISFDNSVFEVTDTKKKLGLHLHYGKLKIGSLKVGDDVTLSIDTTRRNSLRAYHSATHLLHQSLRDNLGDHVSQKGSLVSYDRLRFDFSHHKQLSENEIKLIETDVEKIINFAYSVTTQSMKPEDAIEKGALALFGEKYGDEVRVLSIGPKNEKAYSVELCGGTHVKNTSEIGKFKIVSSTSVAAGIRRIEALRDKDVDVYLSTQTTKDQEQDDILKKKEAHNSKINKEKNKIEDLIVKQIDNTQKILIIAELCHDIKAKELRGVIDSAKKKIKNDGVIVIATENDSKITFLIGVTKNLSDSLSAIEIAEYASSITGGKGAGGRNDFAQSGGIIEVNNNPIKDLKEFIVSKIDS
ncbi:alanine--tRNA ligase [Pelagibacteraceae bacterium]|nr:alanine--tRNA ligase [Pelagibacteraceae bacterium]